MKSIFGKIIVGIIVALSVAFITGHLPDIFPSIDINKFENLLNKEMLVHYKVNKPIKKGKYYLYKIDWLVTNKDHEPIRNASVKLVSPKNPWDTDFLEDVSGILFRKTDSEGKFEITSRSMHKAGAVDIEFNVEIIKEGYKQYKSNIRFNSVFL